MKYGISRGVLTNFDRGTYSAKKQAKNECYSWQAMPFSVKSQKTEPLRGAPFCLMGQHPHTLKSLTFPSFFEHLQNFDLSVVNRHRGNAYSL